MLKIDSNMDDEAKLKNQEKKKKKKKSYDS